MNDWVRLDWYILVCVSEWMDRWMEGEIDILMNRQVELCMDKQE